jgi:glutathione S-transferase
MINVYAFAAVPPFAQGLVRDLRVRWALEEAGLPYRVTLVGDGPDLVSPEAYRKIQPWAQIPAIEDGDLTLFESGAIVYYIAERSENLLPKDAAGRAHVLQFMFTALNTIEAQVQNLASIDLFFTNEAWAKQRRPGAVEMVQKRLTGLSTCLDGKDYLAGAFSAADVLMTTVLRILRHTEIVEEFPAVLAYKQRCEARPAFAKALDAQITDLRAAAA